MKNEKLFHAIGELDDAVLAEAEGMEGKCSRRVGWKVALIAAVVTGLAITAVAAPQIYNALKDAKVETDDTVWISATNPADGSSYEMKNHKVTLEVEFQQNAPRSIESYYMVSGIPDAFAQFMGHIMKNGISTQFGWIVDGTDRDICFYQWAGGSITPETLEFEVTTAPEVVPMHGIKTIAGIQGYLVEVPTLGDNFGEREFYWSDGVYLFCLQVPCDYSDAQLEQMVASIQPVEDITPYLVSVMD